MEGGLKPAVVMIVRKAVLCDGRDRFCLSQLSPPFLLVSSYTFNEFWLMYIQLLQFFDPLQGLSIASPSHALLSV